MSGTAVILIEHNFETAHRLPFLGGKCENLHGHSWQVSISFYAFKNDTGMDANGISVEYGKLKQVVRGWIDDKLDHGCMLGVKDVLLQPLLQDDCKVFVFGDLGFLDIIRDEETDHLQKTGRFNLPAEDRTYATMPWPTVEAVARMIAEKIQAQVDLAFGSILWVDRVVVTETSVNKAVWTPSGEEEDRRAGVQAHGNDEEHSPAAAALRGEDVHP